jgi:hypothetical protein
MTQGRLGALAGMAVEVRPLTPADDLERFGFRRAL